MFKIKNNTLSLLARVSALIIIIFSSILINSCSPEDKLIDNTTNNYKVMIITDESNPVKYLKFPENQIEEDNNSNKINQVLKDISISKVKYFLNKIYFLADNQSSIYVFDKSNYELLTKYEFGANIPIDIVFSNATDAYVIYKSMAMSPLPNNKIGLIDIYFNKFVKDIELNENANITSIISNSYNLYLTLDSKKLVRFDTRDNEIKEEVKIRNICNLSTFTTRNDLLFCIEGDEQNNLNSTLIFVNPNDFKNQTEVELTFREIDPKKIQFRSIANSPKDYSFISTNLGLMQLDTRSKSKPYYLSNDEYNYCRYLSRNRRVLYVKNSATGTTINFADDEYGEVKSSINLPINIKNLIYFEE